MLGQMRIYRCVKDKDQVNLTDEESRIMPTSIESGNNASSSEIEISPIV
jgi:hypothetical protein